MQHGAFDFLQKPFRDQDLLDRVQRALARDAESRAALAKRVQIAERLAALTPRELEVMRLVTRGKANKVIGAELGVSQRTVEIHRAHVMEKMQAGSLAELVRMVLDSEPDTQNP
jgi:FixJ family two-component response regulator